MLVLLAACATLDQPATDPNASGDRASRGQADGVVGRDDPFATIDRATRRIAGEPRRPPAYLAEPESELDLIARIVDRFEFSECPPGGQAWQWARWFGERPDYIERVLNRAHPWLYDIANELEERELPGELALLPIVESAYDPFALSSREASGTWQFLASTALDRGVNINDWYDGRRDVHVATRAALDYLTLLNSKFDGDWNLALAAYNAGQGRVQRAIEANQARNRGTRWDQLTLPQETRAYVPKLHGLGCLFREPDRFDLELPVWDNAPTIARIELPGPTDVVALSAKADLEIAELVALNPGLNGHLTPPGGPHHVFVPVDRAEEVNAVLPLLNGQDHLTWQHINVRRGDTLSRIAQRHNTSVAMLAEVNGLNGDQLSVGQVLRIPSANDPVPTDQAWSYRYQELARLQERLLPSRGSYHEVSAGESLWVIARRHSVSVADLQQWNNMGRSTNIRPGQRLSIRGGNGSVSVQAQVSNYTVRNGDSLWLIARRLNVTLADLMRWNNLHENSVLRPGQVLSVRRSNRA